MAIPTSSQFRWTMLNIGKVDVAGVDLKADARFWRKGWSVDVTFRYCFQQALDHSDPDSRTFGNQIPYIPLHSGGVDLCAGWEDWSFTWETVFTGARWSRTANTPDYYIAPWTVSDISLFRKMTMPALKNRALLPELNAGVTVRNLFNHRYQVVQGYPMPGCNLMFTVEYSW